MHILYYQCLPCPVIHKKGFILVYHNGLFVIISQKNLFLCISFRNLNIIEFLSAIIVCRSHLQHVFRKPRTCLCPLALFSLLLLKWAAFLQDLAPLHHWLLFQMWYYLLMSILWKIHSLKHIYVYAMCTGAECEDTVQTFVHQCLQYIFNRPIHRYGA